MKVIFFSVVLLVLLVGCTSPFTSLPLTPEGGKVFLVGANLPLIIPGKPLDKCTVINQLTIYFENDYYRRYTNEGCDNALRNKTAKIGGNVAILVDHDSYIYSLEPACNAVRGMALSCSEDVLKSAGLNSGQMESIFVNPLDDAKTTESNESNGNPINR